MAVNGVAVIMEVRFVMFGGGIRGREIADSRNRKKSQLVRS